MSTLTISVEMAKRRTAPKKPTLAQHKLYHGGPKHLVGKKIRPSTVGAYTTHTGQKHVYVTRSKNVAGKYARKSTKRTGAASKVHTVSNRSGRFKPTVRLEGFHHTQLKSAHYITTGKVRPVKLPRTAAKAGSRAITKHTSRVGRKS